MFNAESRLLLVAHHHTITSSMTTHTQRRPRRDLVFEMETAHIIIIMSSCIIYDGETIPKNTDKCSWYCRLLMQTSSACWYLCGCARATQTAFRVGIPWEWVGREKKNRLFSSRRRRKLPTQHFVQNKRVKSQRRSINTIPGYTDCGPFNCIWCGESINREYRIQFG